MGLFIVQTSLLVMPELSQQSASCWLCVLFSLRCLSKTPHSNTAKHATHSHTHNSVFVSIFHAVYLPLRAQSVYYHAFRAQK